MTDIPESHPVAQALLAEKTQRQIARMAERQRKTPSHLQNGKTPIPPDSPYQELFELLQQEHGILALEGQMHDIEQACQKIKWPTELRERVEIYVPADEGIDPYITGTTGHLPGHHLEALEKDAIENKVEVFTQGPGAYLCTVTYEAYDEGQDTYLEVEAFRPEPEIEDLPVEDIDLPEGCGNPLCTECGKPNDNGCQLCGPCGEKAPPYDFGADDRNFDAAKGN